MYAQHEVSNVMISQHFQWKKKQALANKHTMNWDSEKIGTRMRTEPRASRCPVENFATAPHGRPSSDISEKKKPYQKMM